MEEPTKDSRTKAYRVIDWVWDHVHVQSGVALFLTVFLLLGIAVYKIQSNSIEHQRRVTDSICHVVASSNQNVGATRHRLTTARDRALQQGKAEDQIASIWRYARRHEPKGTPRSQKKLVDKLIHAQETLAREDRSAARDLTKQLDGVRPIALSGC
jgi:hypothetical protein